MKTDAITKAVLAGEFVFVGEYRQSIAEVIRWRDKTSGAQKSAPVLRHRVETGKDTVTVLERVENEASFDVGKYKPAFNKGAKVVVRFTAMNTAKGNTEVRGVMEALEQ